MCGRLNIFAAAMDGFAYIAHSSRSGMDHFQWLVSVTAVQEIAVDGVVHVVIVVPWVDYAVVVVVVVLVDIAADDV